MKTDKNDYYNSITDDEIRVVGNANTVASSPMKQPKPKHRRYVWWIIIAAAIAIAVVGVLVWLLPKDTPEMEPEIEAESEVNVTIEEPEATPDEPAYVQVTSDTINDLSLRIYIPHGGKPELRIGNVYSDSTEYVFAAQAADVRGDNGEIAGAFILQGELLSKGLSKLGFCSIIDNEITLGRQSETPLFERAIEENGYFFRQYSLVSNGNMIEIKPKGKAVRRALCYLEGTICVIESVERESFHDFAQALADYGVEEAVALVGGDALLIYRTESGETVTCGKSVEKVYQNANYIVWK